jgi:hypothetical protein
MLNGVTGDGDVSWWFAFAVEASLVVRAETSTLDFSATETIWIGTPLRTLPLATTTLELLYSQVRGSKSKVINE